MHPLFVNNPVQTFLHIKNGDDVTIEKVIENEHYQKQCYELRKHLDKGMIKERGQTVARYALSIPMDEFGALLAAGDGDAIAWWTDKNDKKALRRLLDRYPYWRVSSGRL